MSETFQLSNKRMQMLSLSPFTRSFEIFYSRICYLIIKAKARYLYKD